ncbi:hypothetical protein AJ80_09555 [Polytolypa hystricis UAMH7299]|uniref:AB hydrolase-1 domain-containing protein n=1 Tax=Polytolypa hystricis (strain UAMH7299) TaxID=1447883 RepID=A0A2B7WNS1_POLH7|nr:hypothetical protein AJ80_09555 [Polytolypa hystricis UAMH7299]
MALPSPCCTFTIPSVYDELRLDCRIYHSPQLQRQRSTSDALGTSGSSTRATWRKRAAIIAHPYAPLGGCYDDPIVSIVASELFQAGYVVGTFNFRGAAGSEGRTSWTAKPELADYISFYGFMIYYLSGLDVDYYEQQGASTEQSDSAGSCMEENEAAATAGELHIVLAGYSYGSMIASRLPTVEIVCDLFATTTATSAEEEEKKSPMAEIVSKARELAALWNVGYRSANDTTELSSLPTSESTTRSASSQRVSMGSGSEPGSGRQSGKDGRRRRSRRRSTLGGIGRSLERSGKKLRARFEPSSDEVGAIESQSRSTEEVQEALIPTISYLLISPILPPISSLATMSFFASRTNLDTIIQGKPVKAGIPDTELITHQTLAIYGSNDIFTSAKKLQTWAGQLAAKPGSHFRFEEVENAGHFWHERGTGTEMRRVVREWAGSVE